MVSSRKEKQQIIKFFKGISIPEYVYKRDRIKLGNEIIGRPFKNNREFWNTLQKDMKQQKKEEVNRKQRERYQSKKNLEKEIKEFYENIKDEPINPKKRYVVGGKRKSKVSRDGNQYITYRFEFTIARTEASLSDYRLSEVDERVKMIVKDIKEALNLKSIQKLSVDGNYLRISVLFGEDVNDDTGNTISTRFSMPTNLIKYLKDKLYQYLNSYQETSLFPLSFDFTAIIPNPLDGAGSFGKTEHSANKKWYMPNIPSRTNCLYNAVYLVKNVDNYEKLVENDYKLLYERARDLKQYIKKCNKDIKRLISGQTEVIALSNYLRTRINVYDNLYNILYYHQPELNKRQKQKKPINIKLTGNHFYPMIEKHLILDKIEEKLSIPLMNYSFDEDDLIRVKKRNIPYHSKYGSYDIEATPNPNDNNYHKAYACGIAYATDRMIYKSFWGFDCQIQMLDYLTTNMQVLNGYTFYAHNGGKYDYQNLLREALLDHTGLSVKNMVELNGRIINFDLTDGNNKVSFKDSITILSGSLSSITKEMKVKHQKLNELVKHDDITYQNWEQYKPELKKYLFNDVIGLLECILKYSRDVYVATKLNLSNVYTSATISKSSYFQNYYNEKRNPIYTLSFDHDEWIRETYFGGRNEVYKHNKVINGKLYYYDFTSLYPDVGRLLLPYEKPIDIDVMSLNIFNTTNFFGFTDVYVKTIDFTKKPIHGIKRDHKLLFPHFKNWTKLRLFSEEIKLGMFNEVYEYEFRDDCKGVRFAKAPFMKKFFEDAFKKKAEAKANGNDCLTQVYKTIANSGYGFWGLRVHDRDGVEILKSTDNNKFYEYLHQERIINVADYGKYTALRVVKDLDVKTYNVAIASAITSYARMKLWRAINDFEKKGYEVYYCDTDSIITNCKMTEHGDLMHKYCWDGVGDALGTLKNEMIDKLKKHNHKHRDSAEEEYKSAVYDVIPNDVANIVWDKVEKNKTVFDDVIIAKQIEMDGGELCFDKVLCCGCKFYACSKKLYNGKEILVTKLKGYKDDYEPLTFHDYERIISNKNEIITQQQKQFQIPKYSYVSETRRFGLKVEVIPKTFKPTYNKGVLNDNGTITPIIIE